MKDINELLLAVQDMANIDKLRPLTGGVPVAEGAAPQDSVFALRDDQVIAVGDTATEVDRQARETAPDGDFLLMAVEEDLDTIHGVL